MTSSLQGASHTFVAFACLYTVLVCVVDMPNSIGKGLLANAPSIEMFLQYELVGLQPGSANLTTDTSYRDHAFPLLFLDSREGGLGDLQQPPRALSEERTSMRDMQLTSSADLGATPWRSPGKRPVGSRKVARQSFRGIGKRTQITAFCFRCAQGRTDVRDGDRERPTIPADSQSHGTARLR